MSEQAVKTEPKKLKSKVFKWTSAIVAIAILEVAAVTGAVLIMESKHNDRQKDFATLSEAVLQQGKHITELQNLPAAISANAQKIAENAGLLQLYNENFLALKDEVGNKKVEILNQQFSNLNHRLESLEETKSTDALILSAVLLIKENALYNKNFAAEADILAQLAQGQDNIASAVQTIVSLKSLPIASNDELIKNYQQIAEEFTFAVSNEQLQENKEADDNAVGFNGVQNPVRPGKRLNETVHFKVLVHPERIERRRVKARQEHIDHDEQIDLPRLDALGQVFVVILELVRRRVKIDVERLVIVLNRGVQKIARGLVQRVRLKAFLRQRVFGIVFIRSKAEDRRNGQIAVLLGKLAFELRVVFHRHRDGADGKDGVEARHTLTLEGIKAVAFRFLVKMLQRVADDLANALRRAHCLFNVDGTNL